MHPAVAKLRAMERRMTDACEAAGRPREAVRLVAVSKRHPIEAIDALHAEGQRVFGESYAQELRDKARERPTIDWHFIGKLQRNKAKYVARTASLVHAIEQPRVAAALAAIAPTRCLLAVNLAGERSKGGVSPSQALATAKEIHALPDVEVAGLMCIPPATEDPEDAAPFFEELASLGQQLQRAGLPATELSMGMSNDFEVAIRHGATLIRVGTAIFGPRPT